MFESCVFRIRFVILFCNLPLRCALHFYQDFVPPCICLDMFERWNVKWHSDALQTQNQTITVGLMAEWAEYWFKSYAVKSFIFLNLWRVQTWPQCRHVVFLNCLLLSLCPTRVIVKASDGSHKRCSDTFPGRSLCCFLFVSRWCTATTCQADILHLHAGGPVRVQIVHVQ